MGDEFDPDAYIAAKQANADAFDPDAYIQAKAQAPQEPGLYDKAAALLHILPTKDTVTAFDQAGGGAVAHGGVQAIPFGQKATALGTALVLKLAKKLNPDLDLDTTYDGQLQRERDQFDKSLKEHEGLTRAGQFLGGTASMLAGGAAAKGAAGALGLAGDAAVAGGAATPATQGARLLAALGRTATAGVGAGAYGVAHGAGQADTLGDALRQALQEGKENAVAGMLVHGATGEALPAIVKATGVAAPLKALAARFKARSLGLGAREKAALQAIAGDKGEEALGNVAFEKNIGALTHKAQAEQLANAFKGESEGIGDVIARGDTSLENAAAAKKPIILQTGDIINPRPGDPEAMMNTAKALEADKDRLIAEGKLTVRRDYEPPRSNGSAGTVADGKTPPPRQSRAPNVPEGTGAAGDVNDVEPTVQRPGDALRSLRQKYVDQAAESEAGNEGRGARAAQRYLNELEQRTFKDRPASLRALQDAKLKIGDQAYGASQEFHAPTPKVSAGAESKYLRQVYGGQNDKILSALQELDPKLAEEYAQRNLNFQLLGVGERASSRAANRASSVFGLPDLGAGIVGAESLGMPEKAGMLALAHKISGRYGNQLGAKLIRGLATGAERPNSPLSDAILTYLAGRNDE